MKKKSYQHQQIEEKWLKQWEKRQLFQQCLKIKKNTKNFKKLYLLFAFAYPSGSGLHVGHVESKTALDILARYYRMNDYDIFFPVGWDAFGLPAENYAIKTSVPPAITTQKAIDTFRRQIKRLAISYNWSTEIATCHPSYYQWTQWLFLQLYKKAFAYQDQGVVNWCPSCQTVLANEQVVNGLCERCDSEVEQKELKQWFFKITHYQDELITGLEEVDWPKATKEQQIHWIGKKEGIDIEYQVKIKKPVEQMKIIGKLPSTLCSYFHQLKKNNQSLYLTCFTTRPDTNFGATFIVLAPEHAFAQKIASGELIPAENAQKVRQEIKHYLDQTRKKSELERQLEGRKKTGVFTGFYAINNLNQKPMPIWISDFVLSGFGTGAVVGVPGHDKRDFQFAQKFHLEVIRVVRSRDGDCSAITKIEQVQEDEGKMVNSEFLNGLDIHQATIKIMDYLEKKGWGKRKISYKLRDWLISRQRYWGTPIPIIYDPDGQAHMIKDEALPWLLPTDVDFKPTGESPLKSSREFLARTERYAKNNFADLIKERGWDQNGKGWLPEFDTMDTFVDSSWYFLRYLGARNKDHFTDLAAVNKWLPVDLYLIGPEHIVLHLLYSRFFTKFLRDEGYLKFNEPFKKMRHQGMILGPNGKKMSKSKGNVINPDEVVKDYGADTLRIYEMFMGPLEADKPWDVRAVAGVYRFLNRVYQLVLNHDYQEKEAALSGVDQHLRSKFHQTIKKVTADIPKLKFNTAIASMMELVNEWENKIAQGGKENINLADVLMFVKLLAPFAPLITEEMWSQLTKKAEDKNNSIHLQSWPVYDLKLAATESQILAVQVNGKVRGELLVFSEELKRFNQVNDQGKGQLIERAKQIPTVKKWLAGKKMIKEIYIPGKIISLVIEN